MRTRRDFCPKEHQWFEDVCQSQVLKKKAFISKTINLQVFLACHNKCGGKLQPFIAFLHSFQKISKLQNESVPSVYLLEVVLPLQVVGFFHITRENPLWVFSMMIQTSSAKAVRFWIRPSICLDVLVRTMKPATSQWYLGIKIVSKSTGKILGKPLGWYP